MSNEKDPTSHIIRIRSTTAPALFLFFRRRGLFVSA